ncbi:hypothetical protein JAAARDRAFT_394552 [Jaapia argillacea MUCL 33604]|uniref:C3H1-type domain-containing protein n=1 Tax=Jaapia argillacea MUCL 33604 TaxID=933084 RepID=A0A067PI66_9AGAM|nr:hypothetical protein JAAARDRAFT_394552 [Jaapia argillacea MUCL 33604]
MSDQVIGVEGLAAPSELMQSVGERQMAFFSRPQTQSAAVKIVSPGERPTSPRQTPTKKDSTQRQCRNIAIYGSCKFEDKGCIYYHPPAEDVLPRPESPTKGVLPAEAVNAPVFVPKTTPTARPTSPQSVNQTQTSLPTPSSPLSAEYIEHDPYDPYGYPDDGDLPPSHMDSLAAQMHGVREPVCPPTSC